MAAKLVKFPVLTYEKLSFSCNRDAPADSYWNSQTLFRIGGRATEKLIDFGQEKSGKRQEIS